MRIPGGKSSLLLLFSFVHLATTFVRSPASEQDEDREDFQYVALHRGQGIGRDAREKQRDEQDTYSEEWHAPLLEGEAVGTNKTEDRAFHIPF